MSLEKIALCIEKSISKISNFFAWSSLALILAILSQVLLRLLFNKGGIALEELQWHFYAILIMIGLSYADQNGSHVRVDIWQQNFRPQTKKWIEVVGILFLVFPFLIFMFLHSLPFWWDSFIRNESSLSPSGLPFRWIIKAFLPFGLAMLFLSNLSRLLKCFLDKEIK